MKVSLHWSVSLLLILAVAMTFFNLLHTSNGSNQLHNNSILQQSLQNGDILSPYTIVLLHKEGDQKRLPKVAAVVDDVDPIRVNHILQMNVPRIQHDKDIMMESKTPEIIHLMRNSTTFKVSSNLFCFP